MYLLLRKKKLKRGFKLSLYLDLKLSGTKKTTGPEIWGDTTGIGRAERGGPKIVAW